MIDKNTYCVIMAGGIGSRFWPMSRQDFPKQFHDVLGTGNTLLQQTFNRFSEICFKENVFIVTNEDYRVLVTLQLPEIDQSQILCEPSRRNTAPCIAYATYRIKLLNNNANIIVAPSDHLVLKEQNFINTINIALKQAASADNLITLGIKPHSPDTGYGYIQFKDTKDGVDASVKKVKTFTEKPTLEIAQEFISSGDFYWNSGIFIWNVKSIASAFEKYLPELNTLFLEGENVFGTPKEQKFIESVYAQCENISIDYGIMEKAKNAFVVLSDFGWSDLGTWGSLHNHLQKDKNGNGLVGKNILTYESKGNIVNVPSNKLVVIQGLENYIVAETPDVLLICKKDDEQKIKQFVNDIKLKKGDKYI
jgi:mannose-1-phosphate guanylyltransferase